MYVIIRNPITNANVQVESLKGFVTGTPVERESLGIPMSEEPSSGSLEKPSSGSPEPQRQPRPFMVGAE